MSRNTFRHIQVWQDIIRHIQELFKHKPWHIQNYGVFRVLVYRKTESYSEPWCIQNSGTFRTRDIFRIMDYSEPWYIQNRRHTQNLVKHLRGVLWETDNGYNYFRKLCLFSQYQLFMSSSSWNKNYFLK